MRILVLGGTGSMGVPIVKLLGDQGNQVTVTSRRTRKSVKTNVVYSKGDAHDMDYLKELLTQHYQVIVDFMKYTEDELAERVKLLLRSTDQYIFLSSARVYADDVELNENSERLLDSSTDVDFLNSNEYSLVKAREENILVQSHYKNWTIVRPYITYNVARLQLGFFEKEQWLYRVLKGRSVVIPREILQKITTLTYGNDVAERICLLVGKKNALQQVFQITSPESLTWNEVLNIYVTEIQRVTGKDVKIIVDGEAEKMAECIGAEYQYRYDRELNRQFDCKKLNEFESNNLLYTEIHQGLADCLKAFLQGNQKFGDCSWKLEAYEDRLTGERTKLREIHAVSDKIKYIIWRYTPYLDYKL